jgi:hypothetical protein
MKGSTTERLTNDENESGLPIQTDGVDIPYTRQGCRHSIGKRDSSDSKQSCSHQGLGHAFEVLVVEDLSGVVQIEIHAVHRTKLVVVELSRLSDRVRSLQTTTRLRQSVGYKYTVRAGLCARLDLCHSPAAPQTSGSCREPGTRARWCQRSTAKHNQ